MILADTSVWIDHLRKGDKALGALLQKGNVLMHPMVRGELACGSLRDRALLLRLWQNLPELSPVTDEAAMAFIEAKSLMGKGIGFIDVHLLASVATQQGAWLWTRDKRLAALAEGLKLAWKDEAQ
jgi:predicted nucleic acid-binding protein